MERTDRLMVLVHQLNDDELDAFILLATRVVAGRSQYGPLRVAQDARDFCREALEEAVDGMFYAAAALLRKPG